MMKSAFVIENNLQKREVTIKLPKKKKEIVLSESETRAAINHLTDCCREW
jgi:hypothetical protein